MEGYGLHYQKSFEVIKPNLPELLENFYNHLSAVPALFTKIADSQKIYGLKAAQTAHWQALFSGAFDAEYI